MPLKKTSVTIYEHVLKEVESRGPERSSVINRDLDRYYESLKAARIQLRQVLSDGEIGLLLDNLNGTLMSETYGVRLIYANVEDAITYENIDTKWSVDGAVLVEKLRRMDFIQLCAIADAAERWWNRIAKGEQLEPKEALN